MTTSDIHAFLTDKEIQVVEYLKQSGIHLETLLMTDSIQDQLPHELQFSNSQEWLVFLGNWRYFASQSCFQDLFPLFPRKPLLAKQGEAKDDQDWEEEIEIQESFYSLEWDSDALKKSKYIQLEAEDSHQNQKKSKSDMNLGNQGNFKVILMNVVEMIFQYILSFLEKEIPHEKLRQVKSILNEAKPSKSKWASDDRIGQEPLYEALEKVLNSLKGYLDHSYPFLKPVQKREAPNYFDIIKNPMDLGTMTKKLKALQYNSKTEFCTDLDLIWSNCLTYNTLPESIYRKHALAMKRKSGDLLKKVPEIVVKMAGEEDSEDETLKEKQVKGSKGVPLQSPAPVENTAVASPLTVSMDVDGAPSSRAPSEGDPDTMQLESSTMENHPEEEEEDLENEECESFYIRKWRQMTLDKRATLYKSRQILPFGERKAFKRTPEVMQNYMDSEWHYLSQQRFKLCKECPYFDDEIDKSRDGYFLPELYPMASCVPYLYLPNVLYFLAYFENVLFSNGIRKRETSHPSLVEYSAALPSPSSRICKQIQSNCNQLKRIKVLHHKILSCQSGKSLDTFQLPQVPLIEFDSIQPIHTEPVVIGSNEAVSLLLKSTGLLCLHVGFDVVHQTALFVFMDVIKDYLMRLGKSIMSHIEIFGHEKSMQELILLTLLEIGLQGPETLLAFLKRDLDVYGKQLKEVSYKLDQYLESCLVEEEPLDVEMTLEEEQELIASGNYLAGLGVDFLSLKECGIESSAVPLELWNQKLWKPMKQKSERALSSLASKIPLESPSPWKPIDPSHQIGLLKEFYSKPSPDLMEDEFKSKPIKSKTLLKTVSQSLKPKGTSLIEKKEGTVLKKKQKLMKKKLSTDS